MRKQQELKQLRGMERAVAGRGERPPGHACVPEAPHAKPPRPSVHLHVSVMPAEGEGTKEREMAALIHQVLGSTLARKELLNAPTDES